MCQEEINNYNDSFLNSNSIKALNVSFEEFKKFSKKISHLINLEAIIIFEGGWIVLPPNNDSVMQLDKTEDLQLYFPLDIAMLTKLKRISIQKLTNKLPTEISNVSSLEILEVKYANILDIDLEIQKIAKLKNLKQLIVHQECLKDKELAVFRSTFGGILVLK